MNLIHLMDSLDGSAAGPSYSIPSLCQGLIEQGHAVSLLSTTANPQTDRIAKVGFADLRHPLQFASLPPVGKLGLSRALRQELMVRAPGADVLHTHGLWRFANIYPSVAARRFNKPLVLSPRGMLASSALQFSTLSKGLFWVLFQRSAVAAVTAFHATSDGEYEDIRAYGCTQPVAIIPNGIQIPPPPLPTVTSGSQTVVFLGRVHPVKGLDRLIHAWSFLGNCTEGWNLKIVGPIEQGYDRTLLALIWRLKLTNIELVNECEGAEKWRLLQSAELTILPSLGENFGMSVAESLVAGTPVIASLGTPWQGLEKYGCGWWVDNSPHELATALGKALSLSQKDRAEMGRRGQAWMARDFSWSSIAKQMIEFYEWLVLGGETPSFVCAKKGLGSRTAGRLK